MECANQDAGPCHNQDIRKVEHACVKWPYVDDGKVGHKSMAQDPVKEVSRPAGQNERKAEKTCDADTSAAGQVRRKRSQANPDSAGEDNEPRRIGKERSDTQKRTWIFGQLQFHDFPWKCNRTFMAQERPCQVLGSLIAAHCAEEHSRYESNS